LSDGVFAIAMTLLVLDLKVPMDTVPGQLGAALRQGSHEWVSFAITFALAAGFWSLQHGVFDRLDTIGKESLTLTFVFLCFVSVLPFSTSLWGHHLNDPVAFVIYFGNQAALAVVLVAKLEVARAKGHLKPGIETQRLRLRLYTMSIAMGGGVVGAMFLPLQFVAIPAVVVGAGGRVARKAMEKRAARLGGETPG